MNTTTASNMLARFSEINYLDVILAFVFSLAVGVLICYVYKLTYAGVMYSRSFGISLIAMTMITNIAILAVTQNVVLSLGMVGALSIVRFRSAVKEPMEIAFLFWAISEGIVIGAGMVPVALIGAVFVGALLFVTKGKTSGSTPYILVLHAKDDAVCDKVMESLKGSVKKTALKSKTIRPDGAELTVELRLANGETAFVKTVSAIDGVSDVTLVSYNGDYMA